MTTKTESRKDNKHTHRGTCQVCGRAQAVANGVNVLAKHGYTVEWGFFKGVCRGAHNQPLELDKTMTEHTIVYLREDYAPAADKLAADLRSGKVEPQFYNSHYCNKAWKYIKTPCKRNELHFQSYETQDAVAQRQINAAVLNAESDAKHARAHAAMLVKLIEERHGKPLMPVDHDADRVKIGSRVMIGGKKGFACEVVDIKFQEARRFSMRGCNYPIKHAILKRVDGDGRTFAEPLRNIRQSAIIS